MKKSPCIYNDVSDINPPFGHDINKFVLGRTIVVQFQLHLLNFQMSKDPKAKFKYTFQMVSLYLIQPAERHNFSTMSKIKRSHNKWMVTPSKTRNATRVVNPLEQNTTGKLFQNVRQLDSSRRRNEMLRKSRYLRKRKRTGL